MVDEAVPTGVIEIRLTKLDQLFNSLDPAPFHERDLDDDAEEYIVAWVRELPATAKIQILVHLPESEVSGAAEQSLTTAFANYFDYRASVVERETRELFRMGWRYLLIGLPVLVVCFIASQLVQTNIGASPLARALGESFIIVGWVANWKPIETFLYGWWPLRRRYNLYRRLARATVELRSR